MGTGWTAVAPPGLNEVPSLSQAQEPVFIEALVRAGELGQRDLPSVLQHMRGRPGEQVERLPLVSGGASRARGRTVRRWCR